MSYNFNRDEAYSNPFQRAVPQVEVQPLMRLVYLWMMFGLLTTAAISAYIASSEELVWMAVEWRFPILILQFAIVIGISWAFNKISPALAGFLFFVYAVTVGLFLGVWFFVLIEGGQSMAIANAFFTTAGLFGTMTVIGYTTKTDLTKWGSFFTMAIIGLIIAMIVNFFLKSDVMGYVISVVGVLIFTGLTAYDTQAIKNMAQEMQFSDDKSLISKLAIMGALKLYLDFINIFIFLLRLFGGGRR